MKRFAEASSLATAAFDLASGNSDSTCAALLTLFEPTLARIFLHELGSPSRAVATATTVLAEASLSPRTAFLMSRLGPDMRVVDAFDVASMPPLETLRRLLSLVRCGAVHLESRVDRRPPVDEPSDTGVLAQTIVVRPFG